LLFEAKFYSMSYWCFPKKQKRESLNNEKNSG